MENLQELLVEALKDLYNVEQQITKSASHDHPGGSVFLIQDGGDEALGSYKGSVSYDVNEYLDKPSTYTDSSSSVNFSRKASD